MERVLLPRLFIASFLAIVAGTAQDATLRTDVKEVLVPVVVTDRSGRHIPGLKLSDFQVAEDGRPERIVAFRVESGGSDSVSIEQPTAAISARSNGTATVAPGSDTPRRTYLILVDTLHSSFANFGIVRDVLAKFFEKERAVDAQYAVVALGREMNVIQDSTRDPAAVLAAVRSARFSTLIHASEASNIAAAADEFTALMRQYCSVCECQTGNQGNRPECPATKGRVQAFLTSFGERTFMLNERFLNQMGRIVSAIGSMPTSRIVIFISDGFNRFSGRELYAVLMGYAPKDRSFEFNPRDTQPDLEAVLKAATKNDVRFYTIDSRGLYTFSSAHASGFDASSSSSTPVQMDSRVSPNLAAGVPEAVTANATTTARENTDPLAQLARETGGLFFENSNDLLKALRQSIADGREYYVLAYVPDNKTADGKYRKIRVSVRNSKWHVHAKAGYWATAN